MLFRSKYQPLAGFGVFELYAAQRRIEVLARVKPDEYDGLIANQSRAALDRTRIPALGLEVRFCSRHKEAVRLVQPMQALEIQIPPIHGLERAGLGHQQVQHIHVVQLAVADMQEGRDVFAQDEQRVQLDRYRGRAKRGPGKHRKTQADGAGIQCVDQIGRAHV